MSGTRVSAIEDVEAACSLIDLFLLGSLQLSAEL